MIKRWKIVFMAAFAVAMGTECAVGVRADEGPPPQNRREPIADFSPSSPYRQLAQLVGRLSLLVPDGTGTTSRERCTAIAISNRLILTAGHCLEDDVGGPLQFTEAYVVLGKTSNTPGSKYTLKHEPVYPGDESEFDDDIVIMETRETVKEATAQVLAQVGADPIVGNDLFIIDEPESFSLSLLRSDCRMTSPHSIPSTAKSGEPTAAEKGLLPHRCDTRPGSSGAPIFNSQFRLVGLHLGGGKTEDPNSFNRGILISEIMAHSKLAHDVLTRNRTSLSAQDPIAMSKPTIQFNFKYGASVINRDGTWRYVSSGETEAESSPLVEQKVNSAFYVLWDARRDIVFQIPKEGGLVRSRAGSNPTFTDIDEAVRQ